MSQRIEKVNELIKHELGNILLREVDLPRDILVTITRTDTSPDLRRSTIYISVLPETKNKEAVEYIKSTLFSIQHALNKKLHMKHIPKVEFKLDKQAQVEQKVFKILNEK